VSGALDNFRVIELAGIGPAPFAGMLLADAGADVLRIERSGFGGSVASEGAHWDFLARSRPSVSVNLKEPEGVALFLDLIEGADALIEGYRPGVAERMGIGPEVCLGRNPRLVYGRMTGWGQDGPFALTAGHDIDYIALAGALWPIGRGDQPPPPPLNLVGDFGGGGMLLAFGVVCALLEASRSGKGQVVDAAMVDGAAALMTIIYAFRRGGIWQEGRSSNMLDGAAPFYGTYETADGKYFAIGAIERQFYAELLRVLEIDPASLPDQNDRDQWPAMRERFEQIFRSKTRDEWSERFAGTDACGAPVLSPWEAHEHPHNRARQTFVEIEGNVQPAPAPRFSRTPSAVRRPPSFPGADTDEGLASWGVDEKRIAELREHGVLG
jgi:alpha-methylacyl-CoA racemase